MIPLLLCDRSEFDRQEASGAQHVRQGRRATESLEYTEMKETQRERERVKENEWVIFKFFVKALLSF